MLDTDALLKKSDQNLVWLDCEMTGLDPEKERIIEIAVVVTGPQLTPRIEGPVLALHQSDELLEQMDKWNKTTHGRSGLIDKVKTSSVSEEDALDAHLGERQLRHLVAEVFPVGPWKHHQATVRVLGDGELAGSRGTQDVTIPGRHVKPSLRIQTE